MIASKFGIGQQVRHSLLGYLGVVVDIDPEYALDEPEADELAVNAELRDAPWYHVVMEDDEGQPVHTYLAEKRNSAANCRMNIPSSLRWTNWRKPSANSFRHHASITKLNPAMPGLSFISSGQAGVFQWPGSDPSPLSYQHHGPVPPLVH